MRENLRKERFYTIYVCKSCDKELSNASRMNNDGTCPHCGAYSEGTIINAYPVTLRKIYQNVFFGLWYEFLGYEGANESSKEWLNTKY
jgi:predicted RNA-binding Zn-ribbon protein involved in translation (DUF1610 family)